METMYNAKINSPLTTLSSDIDSTATTIPVTDISVFPNAPNLATIGTGNNAETILYTDKSGSSLVGVTRGFQGTAQSWLNGTSIARLFTAYDHDTFKKNIEDLSTNKVDNSRVLTDVPSGAKFTDTIYTHPVNHPASIITQDSNNRFVTDTEKSTWNNKQDALGFTPENSANKNQVNGYAGLDASGKVASSQIPDDVGFPFKIKSAFYDESENVIQVSIASGIGETFNGTTINTITKTSDSFHYLYPVLASTTYTIYLKNDGNFANSTDGSQAEGSLLIGTVSTNADKSVNTIVDKRPLVSGVGSELIRHQAENAQDNVHGLGNRPMVSTEVKTYYIDAVNGDDNNDGLTVGTSFKTWAKTVTKIPRYLDHNLIIRIIGDLPEEISLTGCVTGEARLYILGNTEVASNQVVNGITLHSVVGGIDSRVIIQYLQFVEVIRVGGSSNMLITHCNPHNTGGNGIEVFGATTVKIMNCDFGNEIVQNAIVNGGDGNMGGRVYSYNNVGVATNYGLICRYLGSIFKRDTQPTGKISDETTNNGGVIFE